MAHTRAHPLVVRRGEEKMHPAHRNGRGGGGEGALPGYLRRSSSLPTLLPVPHDGVSVSKVVLVPAEVGDGPLALEV